MVHKGILFLSTRDGRNIELVVICLLLMSTLSDGRNTPWSQSHEPTRSSVMSSSVSRTFPSDDESASISSLLSTNNDMASSSNTEIFATTYEPFIGISLIDYSNKEDSVLNRINLHDQVEAIDQSIFITPTRATQILTTNIESAIASSVDIYSFRETYLLEITNPQFQTLSQLNDPATPRTNTMLVNSLESVSSSIIDQSNLRETLILKSIYSEESAETLIQIYDSHPTEAKTTVENNEKVSSNPSDEISNNNEFTLHPTTTNTILTINEESVSQNVYPSTGNEDKYITSSTYSRVSAEKTEALMSTPVETSTIPTSIHNVINVSPPLSNNPLFTPASGMQTIYSNLAHNFSSFSYIKRDNSENGSTMLTDNSLGYANLGQMTLTTPAVSTDWDITLISNKSTTDLEITPTVVEVSSYPHELVATSVVTTNVTINASSCCLPVQKPQTSTDDKDWAIPVVVCISVVLLVTWVIFIVRYRKFKQRRDPRRHRNTQEHCTPRAQARHLELSVESCTPFSFSETSPEQEQHKLQTASDQQRNCSNESFTKINHGIDVITSSDSRSVTSKNTKGNEIIELENVSPKDREYKDSHEGYKKPSHNQHLKRETDTLRYDNYSFIPSSPEPSNSLSVTSKSHSRSGYKQSESLQDANWDSNDSNCQKMYPLPTDQMHNVKYNEEANKIGGASYPARYDQRSNPQLDDAVEETKAIDLKNIYSRYSIKNYSHHKYNDENGYDNGRKDTGDNKGVILIRASDEEDDSMPTAGLDSVDNVYTDVRAVRPTINENRQGISKCVSFDDTHFRGSREHFVVVNKKKSPTRKISTTSDTATTYLTLPEPGFMTMASCYETVDNLAEVGDSPVGSRFFIGSYSDNIHLMGQNVIEPSEQLSYWAKDNNSEFGDHQENTSSEMSNNENTSTNKNNKGGNSDTKCLEQKDDYVFPIVRKANMKIMAERQQRKLLSKRSSESQNDDTSQVSPISAGKKDQVDLDIATGDSDLSIRKLSLPSTAITATSNTAPSRRVSYPLQIPKIILTQDNEVTVGSEDTNDVQSSTTGRLPRVRRIARANNPFLIEVPSPAANSEKKIRRSSAPSMPPTMETTDYIVTKDRMIRSASGDHLCLSPRQCHRYGLQTPWPRSSEFFDMIQNARRETRSDDERLKKMINDRYIALFNNKYPLPDATSRPTKQSYMQDLPPRIIKLLSDYNHNTLPPETTTNGKNLETRSRYQPIRESPISEIPLERYSNLSANANQARKIGRFHTGSHMENFSKAVPSLDATLSERSGLVSKSDFIDNFETSFTALPNGQSSRPSLAHGTDGQDSDTDIQKEEFLRMSSGRDDTVESKPHLIGNTNRYRSVDNAGKYPTAEIQWKSFEDDLDKQQNRSTPFSAKELATDRGVCSLPSGNLEQPSHDKANDDSSLLANAFPGQILQRPLINDPEIFPRSQFMPHEATPEVLETKRSSTSQEPVAAFPVLSNLSQRGFDDNFDTIINIKQAHSEKNVKTNPDPDLDQNKSLIVSKNLQSKKDALIPPEKPVRLNKKRALGNHRLKRPPSPYLFEANNDTKVANNHRENSPSKNNFQSGSLQSVNRRNSETTSRISSSSSKHGQMKVLKPRSISLQMPDDPEIMKLRAIILETDKHRSHTAGFDDWSKLFNKGRSMFVTSANNTLLEHSNQEEFTDLNNSLSDPELELYFGSSLSSIDTASRLKDPKNAKLQLFDEDNGTEV